MTKDADVSFRHFEALVQFVQRLREEHIAVYSHRYDFLAFGSWVIEVGNRHRRVQLTHDGKEGVLRLCRAAVTTDGSVSQWQECEQTRVQSGSGEIWERAIDLVRRHFAAP